MTENINDINEQKTSGAKKWWTIAVILFLVIIFFVYTNSVNVSKGEYKIGSVLSLTGGNAAYGQSTKKGMDLAIEEINKDGPKLAVTFEDEKSTTEGLVSAFQKIISIDNVPIVIGFKSSNGSLAAAPIANDKKVVMLSTLSGSDDLKDAGDYVFRIREKSATHGKEMARYIKNILGLNRVALYYANAANGISYADAFKKEFSRLGGMIVFDEKYVEKSTDFRSDILKMKVSNPEAVYIAGVATEMAQILVQAKNIGVTARWFASSGAENPKLIEIAKNSAEGLVFTTPAFNPNQGDISIQKFTQAYQKKYGELPNFAAANGYDGVMLVYQVIEKYGYDSESIKKGLYATRNFSGMGGTFSFDEFGEVEKEIMFKVVKEGQFAEIKK